MAGQSASTFRIVSTLELRSVQDGFVKWRQALGRFGRHYSKVERNVETVLALFFLLLGKLREFAIGRGLVLKEEPLSLAIDFVAIQIVLVRPVSVVRDYAQLSARHARSFRKLASRDGIETVESQRIKSESLIRRGSQVVRPRSAKPLFTGSIPVPASRKNKLRNDTVTLPGACQSNRRKALQRRRDRRSRRYRQLPGAEHPTSCVFLL